MTLGELLTRAALRRPEAEAVVDGARRLSYAELDACTASAARGFRRLGIDKRDRVLIALTNRMEHVVVYWALQRLGGVPTPVKEIPKTASGKILRRLLREGQYTEAEP